MKDKFLLILGTAVSISGFSQILFEKGYFVNNSDQRINCLIKNVDWENNPSHFVYKMTEDSEEEKLTIKFVSEFGIDNKSKYRRQLVKIGRSIDQISSMSNEKEPIYTEEELFLKLLVEGKATLYLFKDMISSTFFYQKDSAEILQLVSNKYLTSDNSLGINNRFKQQLWTELKCSDIEKSTIENLEYSVKDLTRFFVEYNKCHDREFTIYGAKRKRDLFNLSIRPGVNFASLSIRNSVSNFRDTDFGSEIGLRLGIESEFILPFNKNKWSFLIEPTYQYFRSEKMLVTQKAMVEYNSIEFPLGLRHYFFLRDNTKLFINSSFVMDFKFRSNISFDTGTELEINSGSNFAFGLGFLHHRYGLELRYQTNRDILADYTFWNSNYGTVSIITSYSLF